MVAVLAKHPQVIVIADEIYEHINYIGKHQSIAQFPEMKDRTVIVNGVSKAYAMTGWRIGFIAGPEWIVKASNKLQGSTHQGRVLYLRKPLKLLIRERRLRWKRCVRLLNAVATLL